MALDVSSGRGALSNAVGRYERFVREAYDDGWGEEPVRRVDTLVTPELAKSIIASNDSPDISFDQSINPYRGCEHGCVYCYARPNHAYVGLSPGLDFESRLFAKLNAVELLEREFAKPGYQPKTIMLGGVTDIYQPIERAHRITRGILETMEKWGHPVALITKSQLVMRDIDVLARLAERNLVKAAISVTTLDRRIARVMEPRATAPHRRIEAIRMLAQAGVPTTVMVAPVVPAINDYEIEAILEEAAKAGASAAGYIVLRLPLEIKELFREWLEAHFPDRATRVMTLVRQMRGGKDYDPSWGKRQRGEGPYARLIADRFARAMKQLGFNRPKLDLDRTQFRRDLADGQQDLFTAR